MPFGTNKDKPSPWEGKSFGSTHRVQSAKKKTRAEEKQEAFQDKNGTWIITYGKSPSGKGTVTIKGSINDVREKVDDLKGMGAVKPIMAKKRGPGGWIEHF